MAYQHKSILGLTDVYVIIAHFIFYLPVLLRPELVCFLNIFLKKRVPTMYNFFHLAVFASVLGN